MNSLTWCGSIFMAVFSIFSLTVNNNSKGTINELEYLCVDQMAFYFGPSKWSPFSMEQTGEEKKKKCMLPGLPGFEPDSLLVSGTTKNSGAVLLTLEMPIDEAKYFVEEKLKRAGWYRSLGGEKLKKENKDPNGAFYQRKGSGGAIEKPWMMMSVVEESTGKSLVLLASKWNKEQEKL